MTNQPPIAAVPVHTDRSTWLIVFGVVEIILGALCALMVPLMVLGQVIVSRVQNGPGQMPVQQVVSAAATYLLLAIFFIAVGYGSIRARRWARALMLMFAWIWLICGILGLGFFCVMMPGIYETMAKQQGHPSTPEALAMMNVILFAILSVIYILMPGVFLLFYGSSHVKATCEWKDPQTRWTDRCPLPVLGLSLMLACGTALYPVTVIAYGGVFPFFGIVLSGLAGSVMILLSSAIWGYLAWGLYKLRANAWWGTIGMGVIYMISTIITFIHVDLFDFYRKMGLPERDLQMLKNFNHLNSEMMVVMMIISGLLYSGYLLFIKKYFRTGS